MSLLENLVLDVDPPFVGEEHRLLRKSVREFVEKTVRPRAREIDVGNEYPRDLLPVLAGQGLLGMGVPEEYGGSGLDSLSKAIVLEELARASGSVALIAAIQGGLAVAPILLAGTEEQKRRYLPRLAGGELVGAFALTEPCCGSDAAGLEMRAEKSGDGYVLNGRKLYITQGVQADVLITFARTGGREERHRGITAFIVEDDGCIEATPLETMGFRGTGTAELRYEDCHVPPEGVLGREGEGFGIAMQALDDARIGAAAIGLGLARAALEEAYQWSLSRMAFDRPIHEFQAVRFQIVDMAVKIQSMKTLAYTAARLRDLGDPRYVWMASAAKLHASITANEIAAAAVRILGGLGYVKESTAERVYRDAKLLEIGEGTNEIQRWIMGKMLYGELSI
ncbi:acyl-CoA dehydrogenase [Aeropyrum pernix]|uniref:Acyl-CoA dehydrogenase n=1 Tax=Aeropyrum pernix TaxID=56636 RepID=A0A401H941_AERPX|nr:acyl-CoA dehydrogenase family protein [Aeropyrum pernix]GBF08849.1 acyl-CoA dehydrogenase [Aeropyrum pernix]